MAIFRLALQSVLNRRTTALLTILSLALSTLLLLGVERIRTQAKESFANTLSGTDLVVGARTGQVQLLLYSVFRIGNATNNITWQSYQELIAKPQVKWSVPLSLGDSHKGYRVLGTNDDYFKYYLYGHGESLELAQGRVFNTPFEAVLGSEVAQKLGYKLGDALVLAHGSGSASFSQHDNLPFTITGILAPTATPVDRTIHVSLEGIEGIHVGWDKGRPQKITPKEAMTLDLTPKQITAFLLGLKSRIQTFSVQRAVNEYRAEPLLAVIPGVALQELWKLMSGAEKALLVISGFVVVAGLLGMLTTLLTSLKERRREMAILRSVGARPAHIFGLLVSETLLLLMVGMLLGLGMLYGLAGIAAPILKSHYGMSLNLGGVTPHEWALLSAIGATGLLMSLLPAWLAYKNSLADGMTIRL
jgi:putative ABC transport system permease protein